VAIYCHMSSYCHSRTVSTGWPPDRPPGRLAGGTRLEYRPSACLLRKPSGDEVLCRDYDGGDWPRQHPAIRQQGVDPGGRVRADPVEHVPQVGERFVPQGLAALHQAQQGRLRPAPAVAPRVQPVPPAHGDRPQGFLHRVVVDRQTGGSQEACQGEPARTGVGTAAATVRAARPPAGRRSSRPPAPRAPRRTTGRSRRSREGPWLPPGPPQGRAGWPRPGSPSRALPGGLRAVPPGSGSPPGLPACSKPGSGPRHEAAVYLAEYRANVWGRFLGSRRCIGPGGRRGEVGHGSSVPEKGPPRRPRRGTRPVSCAGRGDASSPSSGKQAFGLRACLTPDVGRPGRRAAGSSRHRVDRSPG